ncbi:NAD-dependent epimerase/dehydratase family protein [Sphingobacterium thalpophilum]|uniref:NAD-dependent epimerase/dehydratase family protein n=1 Tax=Sphingobacterium thalpophilum TaxID=259 RepID=UPI003D95D5E8
MKVIITGATGMVGEGILLECLQNDKVETVLSVSRRTAGIQHPKLKELLVDDFTALRAVQEAIRGYDACFYCAGVSSVGMKEDKYRYITYDTTLAFAECLLEANPAISFIYVSGAGTDSTEEGKVMWARVKGKTENALAKLAFKKEYNFRPGAMTTVNGQQHANPFAFVAKLIKLFVPSAVLSLHEVGRAMIHAVERDGVKNILEIKDIRALA